MENSKDTEQLRQYLAEAVEMLDDMKPKLALFEKQRYYRFKEALDNFNLMHIAPKPKVAEVGVKVN